MHVRGVYPTHLTRGEGVHVWDANGKRYIDYICGLGTNLLGYGHPAIARAIQKELTQGYSLSLGTTLEVQAAERVKEFFPWVERVKFLKTGTEACMGAIRFARAFNGRPFIATRGYHGWSDEFVSMTPPARGLIQSMRMQTLTTLEAINEQTAAVIVEPVETEVDLKWLKRLKEVCQEKGALLIYDEVITGFRFLKHSVARHSDILPDLIVIGKAMAGGMPLAAICGRADILDQPDVFVSSTYAGERLSLAACLTVMDQLQNKHLIEILFEQGTFFQNRFNDIWPRGVRLQGYGTRGVFVGEPLVKALFFQEACKAGILFGPSWFYAFPHMELNEQVLDSCRDILNRIKTGSVTLEGEMPQSPFAMKVRSN